MAHVWTALAVDGRVVYVHTANQRDGTMVLQQVAVRLLPRKLCHKPGWYGDKMLPSMLCASYVKGVKNPCHGDSGGPLQCYAPDGAWRLVGVTIWGDRSGVAHKPGIYTSIEYMYHMIKKYIKRTYVTVL